MNDTRDGKLEDMLTAWGDSRGDRATDQCLTISRAAAAADFGPTDPAEAEHVLACPICARLVGRLEAEAGRRSVPPASRRAWRWVPLAAAVLIVAAGVGVMTAMMFRYLDNSQAAAVTKLNADDLRDRLGVLAAATERLIDQREQAREQVTAMSDELAKVEGQAERSRADLEGRLAAVAAGARRETERKDRQLQALRDELLAAGEKLTAALAATARQEAEVARVRDDLSRQIARLATGSTDRLAATQTMWKMLRGSPGLLRVGPEILAQMQSAARSADLAARAGILAAPTNAKSTTDLLNRLEGILLRLDLADPNDRWDQRWLAAVVAADVIDVIGAVLTGEEAGGGEVSDELRTFLTQVQAVLLRGACAT